MEGGNGLIQKKENFIPRFFHFDRFFTTKRSSEATKYPSADFVSILKINTKWFCKETANNLVNYFPGISYLVIYKIQ